jgi:hypothetical protein
VPVSFDLYVWGSPQPATAEQAERICRELAAGNTSSVNADARVQGFARELLGQFPALESLADEELEASSWSMTPEISASHVIMTISWSRAQEVAEFVFALAASRGLVCFDPQASVVHNPPGQALAGGLRLEFCDGGVVDRPPPDPGCQPRRCRSGFRGVRVRRPGMEGLLFLGSPLNSPGRDGGSAVLVHAGSFP